MVAFARSQVAAHQRLPALDPAAIGRGVADQIALACKVSPWEGSRRFGVARALAAELPGLARLLARGKLGEQVAGRIIGETRHLTPELRRGVDAQLVAAGIEAMSPRRAAATARRLAYAADPAGSLARGRTARTHRRVGIRPAADTMAVRSGLLPVAQGVACYAALTRHTDALLGAGDTRTRDQVMADTLVERVTGHATAADVPVQVGIVVPMAALLDPADTAAADTADTAAADTGAVAEVSGYGPIPAGIARTSFPPPRRRAGGGRCSPPGPTPPRSWAPTRGGAGSPARWPS